MQPHHLEAEGVRLCYGALAHGFIPYTAIAEVVREQRKMPRKARGLLVDGRASVAYFGMDGATSVALRLTNPEPLRGFFDLTAPVASIYLAVDEPERFVREMRARLESAQAISLASIPEQVHAL